MTDKIITPVYSFLLPSGARVTFENPDGFYPVNPYQSELLAQVAVTQAFDLASQEVGGGLRGLRAAEWCVGNGPAAVSLKKLGAGYVAASDINAESLKCAVRNADINGVRLDEIAVRDVENMESAQEKFHLIAVNPPCGPDTVVPEGASEVVKRAVNGGKGGIHYFSEAVRASSKNLFENGRLAIVFTSTMDVVEGARVLDEVYGGNWYAAPTTPVLASAPGTSPDDARGKKLIAAAEQEDSRTVAYRDGDAVKRLTWIIVARKGDVADVSGERLPLHPYGQAFAPANEKLTVAAARLRNTLSKNGLGHLSR